MDNDRDLAAPTNLQERSSENISHDPFARRKAEFTNLRNDIVQLKSDLWRHLWDPTYKPNAAADDSREKELQTQEAKLAEDDLEGERMLARAYGEETMERTSAVIPKSGSPGQTR